MKIPSPRETVNYILEHWPEALLCVWFLCLMLFLAAMFVAFATTPVAASPPSTADKLLDEAEAQTNLLEAIVAQGKTRAKKIAEIEDELESIRRALNR